MATFELEESDFAGYIDDGEIKSATVASVKVVEKPYVDDETGQKVKKVEFKFVINSDDAFDTQNLWGETGVRFNTHPDCKLRNWSSAILGTELASGFRLDTDHLVGNKCRIAVELYEYEDKKSAPNPDGSYKMKQRNRVSDVLPSREAMASMASATAYANSTGAAGTPSEEPF
jgi:hypothetical protein